MGHTRQIRMKTENTFGNEILVPYERSMQASNVITAVSSSKASNKQSFRKRVV